MFLVFLSTVALWFLLQYLKIVFANRYARKIPTIRPAYPIVGHIPIFWGKSTEKAFWLYRKYASRVDRLGKIMVGPLPVIVVNHPDLLQDVLTRHDLYDKPFFYDFYGLGSGLITERSGEKWRHLRRILNPTFNTRMLNNFIPIMDSRTRKMISRMDPLADADGRADYVDLLEYVGRCSLEIVFSTTMGRNADELRGQPEYMECIKTVMELVGRRIMNANYMVNALYRFTSAYKVEQHARAVCKRFTEQIIHSRRQELEREQKVIIRDDEFHRRSLNFLDQILMIRKDDGTGFTDLEVYYHLESTIAAASDTTALTIANTLLFLAIYPDIQDKVYTELSEVFFSDAIELSQETLGQLRYTEQVIKESLRHCPSAPVEARQTSCEITLDGVRIPKDQILVTNFYTLHRRTDFWGPNPERFDPDRFSPEAIQQRHPYAYLPFSGGLRNCIGSRQAMNTSKIMLCRILQNFELRTDLKQADLRFKFEITLKLVGPHRVKLVRRSR